MKLLFKGVVWCTVLCCTTLISFAQNVIDATAKSVVFAPGVVSTAADEFAPSFMPDGKTVYFSRDSKIYFSKMVNGKWSEPKVASFSGQWNDMDSFISPDGKRLYFSSYRPLDNNPQSQPHKFAHIWYVDHLSGDNWSAPHHLEAPVNLEGVNNYAPSISRSGTLCFFSPRRDSQYPRKSYYAKWLGDHYDDPKPLLLNDAEVKDTFISPNESYLLFTSGKDIFISYRTGAGWTAGKKLEAWLNDGTANASPYVSPDGKFLFYSPDKVHGISVIKINTPKDDH
jgi:Tol biopolymer transport system component